MQEETARRSGIKSLDSGLRLLEWLRDHPSVTVNEAARLLSSAPSTAHRLLNTLKARGFVAQDEATRRYQAGGTLLDIAFGALRNLDVRRTARPHLELLAQQVRETVNLIGLEQASIRYVDVVESSQPLRVASRIGETRPAHCTAAGKVLLAWLPGPQLDHLYPAEELPALTSRSITTKSQLTLELAGVRARGYSTNVEESIEGLTAIAVPVLNPMGNVFSALAIAAPSSRLDEARAASVVRAAQDAARAIEVDLRTEGRPSASPSKARANTLVAPSREAAGPRNHAG
jgi:IclR family acetate operon transcriptional repressor